MIKSIHIKNYILIDEINVEFSKGLNVITGETGSGKSILLNAIDIAFGAKASSDLIKKGADKALIELIISSERSEVKKLLEQNDIDVSEEIIISREITVSASRIRVNGTIVNQTFIKNLREFILDIHSQHQTYAFLQPKSHIAFLDSYAENIYGSELKEYKILYNDYLKLLKSLEEAKNNANATESQIDFLKFQINEIAESEIENIYEDEILQNELKVLENSEKLKELTYNAYSSINGVDASVLDVLSQVKFTVSKAARMDTSLENTESSIIEIIEMLKDVSVNLREYSNSVSNDIERLNEIQERLFILNKLKRKYGSTLQEVLNSYEVFLKELGSIEYSVQIVDELEQKINDVLKILIEKANKISEERRNVANNLSSLMVNELEKLELPKSRFEIRIESGDLTSLGMDNVEFYISANISQDLSPLSKSASGGELSRVMLALKTIFAQSDNIDTVIFDEIDTGISGKASQSVADEISNLSQYRQIILITHQAVIAAKADKHILVTKEQSDITKIDIKVLDETEKLSALASLISGNTEKSSIDFAKSLIKNKK